MTEKFLLDVTPKCNKQCEYCIRREDYSNPLGDQLTPSEIRQFVTEVRPSSVVLSGGEPTIRGDLDLILEALDGTSTGIVTNGVFTDRLLALQNTAHLGTIQYSIHGDDIAASSHIENIRRLTEKYTDRLIHVVPVLTKRNILTAENSLKKLWEMGFTSLPDDFSRGEDVVLEAKRTISIHSVIPTRYVRGSDLVPSGGDWDLINDRVRPYVVLDAPAEAYVEKSLFGGRIGKRSCKNGIPVRADGEVMLCIGFYGPISFGNVKNDPHEAMRKRRDFMDGLDERRAEIYPIIKQTGDNFRIYCSRQIEKIFDHPELYKPVLR